MVTIPVEMTTGYPVGCVVETTEAIGPNAPGQRGVVYESVPEQDDVYCSIILEDGSDLGAMSETDADYSVVVLGQSPLQYCFSTPKKLMSDYAEGVFTQAFIGPLEPAA